MTEFEKMRSEEFYDFTSEECLASYFKAKHICAKLQTMTVEDEDYRETIEALIPGIPESSTVAPPFYCDHGHGIKLGENILHDGECICCEKCLTVCPKKEYHKNGK